MRGVLPYFRSTNYPFIIVEFTLLIKLTRSRRQHNMNYWKERYILYKWFSKRNARFFVKIRQRTSLINLEICAENNTVRARIMVQSFISSEPQIIRLISLTFKINLPFHFLNIELILCDSFVIIRYISIIIYKIVFQEYKYNQVLIKSHKKLFLFLDEKQKEWILYFWECC